MGRWIDILDMDDVLSVRSFGIEEDGTAAHWGPGVRQYYFLHLVLHGRGYYNNRPLSAGDGFVIYPGQLHEYHADPEEPWNYIWIVFSGAQAEAHLAQCGITIEYPIFSFALTGNFEAAYKEIMRCPETSADPGFALGLLYMFFSFIRKSRANTPAGKGEAYVRRAMEYIKSNYDRKVRITDIAQTLWLDEGYLYNLFMRYAGMSPKEYLNRVRLGRARELLAQTPLQVSEIARSVGYDDPLQFSRFFKAQTGVSPLAYRKNHSR
ncbi:MAG: helix-turn-helix domain-containing protein [Eubacteriales bacterium]